MTPREELNLGVDLLYTNGRSIQQIENSRLHYIENIKTCVRYLADEDNCLDDERTKATYVLEKQLDSLASEDKNLNRTKEWLQTKIL